MSDEPEDKAFRASQRMFRKLAKICEERAAEALAPITVVEWAILAKEFHWAATGEDGPFTLSRILPEKAAP